MNEGPDPNDPRIKKCLLGRELPHGFQVKTDASTIVSQIWYHSAIMGNYALQFMPTGGSKNRTLVCKKYVKCARAYAILYKTETFLTYW
jgi:hypothetical protein